MPIEKVSIAGPVTERANRDGCASALVEVSGHAQPFRRPQHRIRHMDAWSRESSQGVPAASASR
jgi:hypothetical protein